VNCCVRSLAQVVKTSHIIDGLILHVLLLEVFTDVGIGTMILGSQVKQSFAIFARKNRNILI
jgi:acetylglutamate kinase